MTAAMSSPAVTTTDRSRPTGGVAVSAGEEPAALRGTPSREAAGAGGGRAAEVEDVVLLGVRHHGPGSARGCGPRWRRISRRSC